MLVVTAATGQLGRRVVDHLLERTPVREIRVAVRDPETAQGFAERGVQVRRGDYDDPESLRTAFDGADRLLFISSPVLDDDVRIPQHERVIRAAEEAGVGRVLYTSFLGSETDRTGGPRAHYVTERALEQSGVPYTVLRNPFYTDGLLPPAFLRACVASGEVEDASGGRAVNSASRGDLAEATAAVLCDEADPAEAYDFTGPPWTFSELAEALRRASGRRVTCRSVDVAEAQGAWRWLFGLIRTGSLERTSRDLEVVLGRRPAGIDAFVVSALDASPASK